MDPGATILMTDHDFTDAVESLIRIHNGQPGRPPLHYPAPLQPRAVPPANPRRVLARQARADVATVARAARARRALARITRRAA